MRWSRLADWRVRRDQANQLRSLTGKPPLPHQRKPLPGGRTPIQLALEACGTLGVAIGLAIWILPIGIVAGSLGLFLISHSLDEPAHVPRER